MSVDYRMNPNMGEQGQQRAGSGELSPGLSPGLSSGLSFGRSNGQTSFLDAVDIAKNERINGGFSRNDTQYSDAFHDFTAADGSAKQSEPYFLPITEGKATFSAGDPGGNSNNGMLNGGILAEGFDVTGSDDDGDPEELLDPFRSDTGGDGENAEAGETGTPEGGMPESGMPVGDEDDYGELFDDDTESEIDFDATGGDDEPAPEKEAEEESFGEDEFFEKEFGGRDRNRKMILLICAAAVAVLLLFALSVRLTVSSILGDGTVYEGVLLNGYSLAGMTREEVASYIRKNYVDPVGNASITVRFGNVSEVYALTNFVQCPDAEQLADEAISIARTGGKTERIREILALKRSPRNLALEYLIMDEMLDEIVASATDISLSEPVNPSYEIRQDVVVFTSGRHGTNIDVAKFRWELASSLDAFKEAIVSSEEEVRLENIEIEVDTQIVEFSILKAQEIYNAAHVDAEDAYFYRTENGEIAIHDHVRGRNLDIEALNAMVRRINSGEEIAYAELPYVYTEPSVTSDFLRARLFTDTLNQTVSVNKADLFSTADWAGKEERSVNLRLAAAAFGRVTLLADESVSFLSRLGTVSSTAGYVNAYENVFGDGKKILGGGLSQMASALYTAALKSGLEISEHHNNPYYPNYGLAGFDAFVGNGSDLVIRNNREYPVSIEITYDGESIVVTVRGVSSGAQAVLMNVTEVSNTLIDGGNRLVYEISISQGYSKTPLGSVTYLRLSEDPLLPPGTETAAPSETPGIGTGDPSQTPDSGTGEPTGTGTPTDGTAQPTAPAEPTGVPTATPDAGSPGPATETPPQGTPVPGTESPAAGTPAP